MVGMIRVLENKRESLNRAAITDQNPRYIMTAHITDMEPVDWEEPEDSEGFYSKTIISLSNGTRIEADETIEIIKKKLIGQIQ